MLTRTRNDDGSFVKVQCKNGWAALLLADDLVGFPWSIVAMVTAPDGNEEVVLRCGDGSRHGRGHESPWDLIPAPEKVEGWVNVYQRKDGSHWFSDPHPTPEDAVDGTSAIARYHVSITPGEGLTEGER